jgi:hypothetical protein
MDDRITELERKVALLSARCDNYDKLFADFRSLLAHYNTISEAQSEAIKAISDLVAPQPPEPPKQIN